MSDSKKAARAENLETSENLNCRSGTQAIPLFPTKPG